MSDDTYLIDQGDMRKYRIEIPNIVDDMNLSVFAFRVYAHIKRISGANGGSCWQSTTTLANACSISRGSTIKAKKDLEKAGLIAIEPGDNRRTDIIRIIDIWPENFSHFASISSGSNMDLSGSPRDLSGSNTNRSGSPRDLSGSNMDLSGSNMDSKKEPFKKEPFKKSESESQCSRGEPLNSPTPPLVLDDIPVTPSQQPSSQSSSKTNRTGTHKHIDPRGIGADGYIKANAGKTAYEVYRESFALTPTQPQIRAMDSTATDLDKWREITNKWALRGHRSNNIADMLQIYLNGWRDGNGSNNGSQSTETDPDVEMWIKQSTPSYTAEELRPMTKEEIDAIPF